MRIDSPEQYKLIFHFMFVAFWLQLLTVAKKLQSKNKIPLFIIRYS